DPEGIARLRHAGTVDEVIAAVDADDSAPRADTDDRADALGLHTRVDDVAVGTGELIGHEDHGSARSILGVTAHLVVAAGLIPGHDRIGEAFGHQGTRVPAAVEPHIGDDTLAAHGLPQIPVQLR